MAIWLKDIPGYAAALNRDHAQDFRAREDTWLGLSHFVAGFQLRVMTVRDYVALLRIQSPFIHRLEPTFEDLGTFLWMLSPQIERWHNHAGWRKPWLVGCRWPAFSPEHWQIRRLARTLRRRLNMADMEKTARKFNSENPGSTYELPLDCPLSNAFKGAFDYIEKMFMDKPKGIARDGAGAGLLYLTSWFDAMQSEYHFSDDEIWRMPVPKLFGRLQAIRMRRNPEAPSDDARRDAVNQRILAGLQTGEFNELDLVGGKVKLSDN